MKRTLVLVAMLACAPSPRPVSTADRAAALVIAVRSDSLATVLATLADGVSPDTLAPDGTRPLTEAARHNRIRAATALLDAGARFDLADSSATRPLDYAVGNGHRVMAAMLVVAAARDAGAGSEALRWFEAVQHDEHPADWHRALDGELVSLGLSCAVLLDRPEIVASLRHVAGVANRTGYPPLLLAARFGNEAIVILLLNAGANPDAEVAGHLQETALMEAARDGYVTIGRDLLRSHARVDHADINGETALMWAVRAGETEFARMLLENGASRVRRNRAGQRAADIAHDIRHAELEALFGDR